MNQSRNLILPTLCLASTSPRRLYLLTSMGIPFQQASPQAPEIFPPFEQVGRIAAMNAHAKAASVLASQADDTIVIGADTLVSLDGKVLGKPSGTQEAKEYLRWLSGKTHFVDTGLSLLSKKFGERQVTVRSEIEFHPLSDETIEAYAKTKEPLDKAGAYACQGLGARFIKKVEGSYWNVVGFPLERFLDELEALTQRPAADWFG